MPNLEAKITITAIDKVSAISKQISKSLDGIKTATSNLGNSWRNVGNAATDVVGKIRMLAVATVGAGVAVFGVVKHYATLSEELLLASEKSGVAAESLQKLQFVAKMSNVPVDQLNVALKFLNKSIAVAASNPTSDAAAAFNSMGLNVHDATGKLKSADVVMLEMSDHFKNSTNTIGKVATATALLGRRTGQDLIPILNKGSAAIKEQGDQLGLLGHIMTAPELQAGKIFSEDYKKLETAVGGFAGVLSVNLLPVLEPILQNMTQWVVLNKLWLSVEIKKDVLLFADALKVCWQFILRIKDAVMPVIVALGGFKTIIGIIAGIYIARLGLSIINLIGALGGLVGAFAKFSLALLASPITWFVAGIALISLAGYELIKHWTQVKAFMSSIWGSVRPYFESFANAVTLGMYNVVKSIINNWNGVSSYLKAIVKSWMPVISDVLDWILQKFGTSLNAVSKVFNDIFAALKLTFTQFIDFVSAPFEGLAKKLGGVLETVMKVKDAIFGATKTATIDTPKPANTKSLTQQALTKAGAILQPLVQNNQGLDKSQTQAPIAPATTLQSIIQTTTQNAGVGIPQQATSNNVPARIDINMEIDYEGRPTKVTAKSPEPIIFAANVGRIV